jgi:hypothetical protein
MTLNMLTFPFFNLFWVLLHKFWQCLDRGCTFNRKKTKKEYQSEWNKLYTGPEFSIDSKYVGVLVMIFIALMYGSALPLLYIVSLLYFIFRYW